MHIYKKRFKNSKNAKQTFKIKVKTKQAQSKVKITYFLMHYVPSSKYSSSYLKMEVAAAENTSGMSCSRSVSTLSIAILSGLTDRIEY